jgi:uncharacterized protein YyaL (SSP411 family)
MIALALAAGVGWAAWSTGTMDRARRDDRAVFVVVADGKDSPLFSDDDVAEVLASRFVSVRVSRDERPDVADLVRLSLSVVSEAAPPRPESPLWAIFTASLHPLAAGSLVGVAPTDLARGLGAIADAYGSSRPEMEAKAGIAAVRVAAAQASDAGGAPLGPATIERAVTGAEAGTDGWGALRLLRAEVGTARSAAARMALAQALDRLAGSPPPPALAAQALRLRALAEGDAVLDSPSLAAATRQAALTLMAQPQQGGAFVDRAESRPERVFAYANGLAAGALAVAARVEGDAASRESAARAITATLAALGPWADLARCAAGETRCGRAYLEDYAFLAEALLDLHDATGDGGWGAEAQRASDAAIARFLDAESGGFFDTDAAHEPLPVRLKDPYDGERPSGNGVMVSVLTRLARATGERRYAELARHALGAFEGDLERAPRGLETLAAAAVPVVTPTPAPPAVGLRPSRETRGAVTVEASLDSGRAGAGAALEARIHITVAPPWTVNGHSPADSGVPLTISVPDSRFRVGPFSYPPEPSSSGPLDILVPLRVARGVAAGPAAVRVAVRFQACRGPRCSAPESVVLDAPLALVAGGH